MKRLSPTSRLSALALLLALPLTAGALEFRSVVPPKAVLFDAPSLQGKKLYVIGQGYPLEVIVNLGDWLKVRDNQGGLSWIEAKQLGNTRTLLIAKPEAELRQSADAASPLLARLQQHVVVGLVESAGNGWVKVKHRDGLVGYVAASAVWGL